MSKKFYCYGVRLREFSPGCQPMDGFVTFGTNFFRHIGYPYILIYNRKLTEKEILDYELDFMKEGEYPE